MSLKNKQIILLLHAKPENAINLFSTNNCSELNSWIYLGKNVTLFSKIENIVEGRLKRIDNGQTLQDAASKIRKPYIDFVGRMAKKEKKMAWILSSISEKNVYLSDLFLMLCYLESLDCQIKKNQAGICVFCEQPALIRVIRKNYEKRNDLEIQYIGDKCSPLKTKVQRLSKKISITRNKILFFYYFFIRIFYAKMLKAQQKSRGSTPSNKPVIVIHSWTDQRSFLIDGSFSEAYFGNLGKILENNGNNFLYIMDILDIVSYPKTLKKLSELKIEWQLFEGFLAFSDIIRAWYLARGRKTKVTSDVFFLGREISELINEEYAWDQYSNRAEIGALYYFAACKMAKQFSIKTFVYTFENHLWERMTIEGIHNSSCNTKIVGYAHATVNRMYLCYSLSAPEKKIIPIPDIILVNGPRSKECLVESGFENNIIQIIGSLRFGNFTSINKRKIFKNSKNNPKILVVLSCDLDRSLEMVFKCVKAFSDIDELSIIFKLHPISNPKSLMQSIGEIPKKFTFSSQPINTLFNSVNLVIYSDSTASVEAASMGIPLLHVKSDFLLDINIFEDFFSIPSVSSPQQIRIHSQKILNGDYPSFEEIQSYVKQIFSTVDEQKIIEIIS
jgi:hypothetical protein